jgi:hypothetical protein
MGLPVTERGGPPGGGGMGRPEALVGGCTGAEGGATGGAAGLAAAWGGAGGRGAAGAGAGADAAGADGAEGGADGAAGWACAAGATGAGAGVGAGVRAAGTAGAVGRRGVAGAGAGARGAATGGCSEAGRLVTSRAPVRLIGGVEGASGGDADGSSSPTGDRTGPSDVVTSGRGSVPSVESGAVFLAAAFLVAAAFLAGAAGSSGWTGRRRPSRSAFLRARSAWASSMDEEWLFTPIPRDRHRSSASLLVSPSS